MRSLRIIVLAGMLLATTGGVARPVVVIDPGHGGAATGCEGFYGVYEKVVTLKVALLVQKYLKQAGISVVMTRRGDWDLPLYARADVANTVHADCFVSIHCNASLDLAPHGIETYTYGPGTNRYEPDQMVGPDVPPVATILGTQQALQRYGTALESHVLALSIQQSLVRGLKAKDRGVRQARYAVLHYNRRPAVVAEIGFLTNEDEGKRLLDPKYQDHVARLLVRGIKVFLKRRAQGALDFLVRRRLRAMQPLSRGRVRSAGARKRRSQASGHENAPGPGLKAGTRQP